MAFKMKGFTFPGITTKGNENRRDGRSKSSAFQKNGEAKSKRRTPERHNPDELKSKGLIQRDDGMITNIKKGAEVAKTSSLKKDDIVQKNKQKQFNKKVNDLRGQWRNLKDRNSNKAKQLKKEASKIGLSLDESFSTKNTHAGH